MALAPELMYDEMAVALSYGLMMSTIASPPPATPASASAPAPAPTAAPPAKKGKKEKKEKKKVEEEEDDDAFDFGASWRNTGSVWIGPMCDVPTHWLTPDALHAQVTRRRKRRRPRRLAMTARPRRQH